jgi:outer membrane protein assembly factor BamA
MNEQRWSERLRGLVVHGCRIGAAVSFLSFDAMAAPGNQDEFTPFPLIGGSSDIGFGGGLLASFAHHSPGYEPYVYRLELASITTFRGIGTSKTDLPYQDHYLLLSWPHARRNHTRLELRVSYTRESNLKYYGLGNRSTLARGTRLTDSLYEYGRTHPEAQVRVRQHLYGRLYSELQVRFAYNRLSVAPGSLLASESVGSGSSGNPEVRGDATHYTLGFGYGLVVDLRDNDVATTRGQYYSARLDLFPGGTKPFPYPFARFNTSWRLYFGLSKTSTLGLRVTTDLLFGDVPVYELARYDDTYAFGGSKGVRGIPAQRYHGLAKVFANLQWRQVLVHFRWLGKDNALAVTTFIDGGRLWASYRTQPELDGRGIGLKWGVGAGPQWIAGKSFLIRADLAWSPDARPIGAYLAAGDIF